MQSRRGMLATWSAVAVVLVALGIPWFLWGDATVVAGLPVWVWWHVGWLGAAAVAFQVFATRAWGLGVEPGDLSADDGPEEPPGATDRAEDDSGADATSGGEAR